MFDISFGELLLIAIVALVVIGPEKLPKVARTLGLLAGRMQRYVGGIRADITREMQLQDLAKMQEEIQSGLTSVESGIAEKVREVEAPFVEVGKQAADAVQEVAQASAEPSAKDVTPPSAP